MKKAFNYMKHRMERRYGDLAHPLLKKKIEPVEAYQKRKESKNGQTPLDSCETDKARRIRSEKRRLNVMNVDVGDVRKRLFSNETIYRQKRMFESDMNRRLSEEATVQASVSCSKRVTDLRTVVNRSIYVCIESSKDKLNREAEHFLYLEIFLYIKLESSSVIVFRKLYLFKSCNCQVKERGKGHSLNNYDNIVNFCHEIREGYFRVHTWRFCDGSLTDSGFRDECLFLYPKVGKIGSGTGKRKGEGRFVPGTGKDLNANTQKETVTKETSGQLREQTQQLKNVQEQITQKDEQLSEVTQQLANVQEQLQERNGQLRALTQQLTNYQGTLLERDGQLRSLTQDLTNVEGQLQEKDGQLRQMTQRLTNLEGQLQETLEENTFLEERLRAKEQELNEFEESLATAQRTLCERQRQQSLDWVILRDQVQLTEKRLGKGGWGRVVKGEYCGCTVAVKQIYQELLNLSSHNRELFEREMNIASRCRHPCLLQFIGATNDEGSPLFVTELMESSLRKLLEQRSLSTAEVAVISLDVARALNYLHKTKPRPIIHRDISSANVLLWRQADQWRGKVSDYGAANFMQLTMSVCPGVVIYSAPEAITKHQTVKVCRLLSLSCTMYICHLFNL
ncbi:unnamed protein product [Porites evermanni]|uniref:Protein kinase domain-containing protein n=1 Tax=Porites evermanni TaxID=104178 RepID=A0ABN8RJF5_9CNID|nr:unnamed protein product [Porites evermanni]